MRGVRAAVRAAAPPERVFRIATDLRQLPEIIEGLDRVEVLTDGPMGEGTRWRETRTLHGRQATEEMRVTAFDPPRSFVVEADSHGVHYRTAFSFEPEGAGTRVAMEFTGRPRTLFARAFSLVMGRFMERSLRKVLERDLEDVRRAAEAGD